MKKVMLLLVALSVILIGCGKNELNAFVDDFNQSARKYDATELKESEFGEIEKIDDEEWRNVFESKEYSIDVMEDKKKIVGYFINVKSDKTSIDKNGKGYNAILTLADTLDLNIRDLENGMQTAFNEKFHDYEDEDYEIGISVVNITSASMSIIIEEK